MEWLERGKGDNSHSGGESSSSFSCWNCSTCRAWLSIFCIDFFAIIFSTSFWMLQICLIGNWKHYRARLLPAQTIAVFLREILVSVHRGWKIPRGHFRSINYSCAFWCLSQGKMSNNQQNSCLLLVVLWSKSQSRGQQQHFIWLHRMYFCQGFPICKICGWSEDTNRRVVGQNNKVDTKRCCLKISRESVRGWMGRGWRRNRWKMASHAAS